MKFKKTVFILIGNINGEALNRKMFNYWFDAFGSEIRKRQGKQVFWKRVLKVENDKRKQSLKWSGVKIWVKKLNFAQGFEENI